MSQPPVISSHANHPSCPVIGLERLQSSFKSASCPAANSNPRNDSPAVLWIPWDLNKPKNTQIILWEVKHPCIQHLYYLLTLKNTAHIQRIACQLTFDTLIKLSLFHVSMNEREQLSCWKMILEFRVDIKNAWYVSAHRCETANVFFHVWAWVSYNLMSVLSHEYRLFYCGSNGVTKKSVCKMCDSSGSPQNLKNINSSWILSTSRCFFKPVVVLESGLNSLLWNAAGFS